jgi:HK97 family phage prohead protease
MSNSQLIPANKAFRFSVDIIKASGDLNQDFFVDGYASTSALDRQGDIIVEQALKDAADALVSTNSTVFFGHTYDLQNSVGRIVEAIVDTKGLKVKIFVSTCAQELRTKLKEGVISKFSIGGRVISNRTIPRQEAISQGLMTPECPFDEINLIEKMELFEVSFVGVPANAEAQVVDTFAKSMQKLFSPDDIKSQEKGGAVMENLEVKGSAEVPQITPPVPEVAVPEIKKEEIPAEVKKEEPKVEPEVKPEPEAKAEVTPEEIKDLLKDEPKADDEAPAAQPEKKPAKPEGDYPYAYYSNGKAIQDALVKIQASLDAILALLQPKKAEPAPEVKVEEPKQNEELKALTATVNELKAFITEKVKVIEISEVKKSLVQAGDPISGKEPGKGPELTPDEKFYKFLTKK